MMGNLWKKEPTTATDLLVDLFGDVPDQRPITIKRADRKNNARAVEYRQQGNQLFKQNRYHDAIQEYNQCLCYAEPAGDQIALAYANRAACFLRLRKYEHCLADIEAAIAANYPARLMGKLLKRKADCLEEERVNGPNGPTKPKLKTRISRAWPMCCYCVGRSHVAGTWWPSATFRSENGASRAVLCGGHRTTDVRSSL